jgi:hypothetical protein
MPKAVKMKAGAVTFLAEIDESVEIPGQIITPEPLQGVPEGLQPVVDLARVERQFTEVRDLIVACCNGLFDAISSIPNPEKVAIEFGIKLAGEAGIPMLTKASGEANFKISIEWKKDKVG